ncbi:hypothetical protein [uncultured Shewanella sp.]|uniref:hypothetical protein n=1 Tax=uncultured Shewanella sp. TaxID=173975 RepID=UPI00261E757C|nr:hypothetical protein [uncultured Shewanella sp.]
MYKEFKENLHSEKDSMENAGIAIDDNTVNNYKDLYHEGGFPCPACFIRKSKTVSMKCTAHDWEQRVKHDLFECPECLGFIEVCP